MKVTTKVLILLLVLGLMSCNRPQANPTVVLIVRHAEKASDAEDSPLTEAGAQRAQALVQVALDAGVSAIYSSQFKRNRDTAQPLADRLGVAVTEMPVNLQSPGDYGKVLARDIIEKHAGQTVAVVGHGNTIASTIEGLTGRASSVSSPAYSDLFIVVVPPAGAAKVMKAQYGLSE
ncbi:MAG TPA: phosphoglycerate mutase family protein [Pyrinomonadaceae bacterium]|jgi:broad specificity phosphatase PhoE